MWEIIYAVPFTNAFYHLCHVKVAHEILQKNVETTGTARPVWIKKEQPHFSCFSFTVLEIFFLLYLGFSGLFCFLNLTEANQTVLLLSICEYRKKEFQEEFSRPLQLTFTFLCEKYLNFGLFPTSIFFHFFFSFSQSWKLVRLLFEFLWTLSVTEFHLMSSQVPRVFMDAPSYNLILSPMFYPSSEIVCNISTCKLLLSRVRNLIFGGFSASSEKKIITVKSIEN